MRQRDQDPSDVTKAAAAKLLGAVGRLDANGAMQLRVRRAVMERRRLQRPGRWVIRPAVALITLLLAISVAAATIGRTLYEHSRQATLQRERSRRSHGGGASAAAPLPTTPAVAYRGANGGQLVVAGLKALRIERDAAGAAALFDEYLRLHPDGELLEESLGYAIEAAAVRHDRRASALAQRYLTRFPQGRFCAIAERARRQLAH